MHFGPAIVVGERQAADESRDDDEIMLNPAFLRLLNGRRDRYDPSTDSPVDPSVLVR